MIDLYICSLLAALRSLFFNSYFSVVFLFANPLLFPACILSLISSCIEFLLFICDPSAKNCLQLNEGIFFSFLHPMEDQNLITTTVKAQKLTVHT